MEMTDREKVIKGLEVCVDRVSGKYTCNECPYEIDGNYCEINLAKDALALLKKQEHKDKMFHALEEDWKRLKERDAQKFFVDENGKITPLPIVFPNGPLKEQEVKTGKWIEQTDYLGDTYYDCSVCNESWITIEGTPWVNGMNYCPHCGAKMEFEGR